jgi:hypothetical protein
VIVVSVMAILLLAVAVRTRYDGEAPRARGERQRGQDPRLAGQHLSPAVRITPRGASASDPRSPFPALRYPATPFSARSRSRAVRSTSTGTKSLIGWSANSAWAACTAVPTASALAPCHANRAPGHGQEVNAAWRAGRSGAAVLGLTCPLRRLSGRLRHDLRGLGPAASVRRPRLLPGRRCPRPS